MILPTDDICRRVMRELDGEPALTEWEYEFVSSNQTRTTFTDRQREIVAKLMEKYEC